MTNIPKTLSDLLPDRKNRRKHTARNVEMLQESLEKVGTGRSIVIDENNEVLAGNATIKAAANIGLSKVRVIEVDGTEVVAVRRTGLSDQQKRELALYDNRVAEFAEWDVEQLKQDVENNLDMSVFFETAELDKLLETTYESEDTANQEYLEQWAVLVDCSGEEKQAEVMEYLQKGGYECRALIS